MRKFLLFVIGLFLLIAVLGFLVPSAFSYLQFIPRWLLFAAELIAAIMMLFNGTFISTIYFKVAFGIVICLFIGVAMKILHLPGADEALLISCFALPVLYTVYFISKNNRTYSDVLKLLVAYLIFIPYALAVTHIMSRDSYDIVGILTHAIFWLTFIDFLIGRTWKKLREQ